MGSNKIVQRRYDVQVTTAGQQVQNSITLDVDVEKIKGVMLTSDREDLMYLRGSFKLQADGSECFPDGTPARVIMFGLGIGPGNRYEPLGNGSFDPGNMNVTLDYNDTNHPQAVFEPYTVSLYIHVNLGEFA